MVEGVTVATRFAASESLLEETFVVGATEWDPEMNIADNDSSEQYQWR